MKLDIEQYNEQIELKDLEIKSLKDQKFALSKAKNKKNGDQEIINQLNEQINKDVTQIMDGRAREANQ